MVRIKLKKEPKCGQLGLDIFQKGQRDWLIEQHQPHNQEYYMRFLFVINLI